MGVRILTLERRDIMKRDVLALARQAETWLEAHKQEMIEEIQAVARIPSVSRDDMAEPGAPFGPDCRRVLDHMLQRGQAYGFSTRDLDGYAGVISLGDPESAIGIVAHLDVVPVGDGWIYPPFGATYLPEHDALIGRGVDDNKSAAIMGLFLMRMIRDLRLPLRHGVSLYCGTSEETGMQDMHTLVERGEQFPAVSLVPDAGFPVNYGQKGNLDGFIAAPASGNLLAFDAGSAHNIVPDLAECLLDADIESVRAAVAALDEALREALTVMGTEHGVKISASGRASHAADPDRGINAIHLLARALTEGRLLTGTCREAVRGLCELTGDNHGQSEGAAYEDEISGKLTLVYSIAHLTDGVLRVGLDSRYPITCPPDQLMGTLEKAWAERGYTPDVIHNAKPFYIPKDDPRIAVLQEVYETITGRDDPPYTMGGGTYSKAVPNAISFGMGMPGLSDRIRDFLPEGHGGAHGRDEVLLMEKVETCAKIYLAAIAVLDDVIDG